MNYLALDLGKRHDYSAIAIVERLDGRRGYGRERDGHLVVRYLERVPLGTKYPTVVEHVRNLVLSERLRGQCAVVVDATGLGEPVIDMLRAARLGCELTAVTINGGMRESGGLNGMNGAVSVPKQDLIAGVQVMLECDALRVAAGLREAGTLAKELMDIRATGGSEGRVRYGADGAGEHDDLAIALALAVWRAKKGRQTVGERNGRLL